MISPGGPRKRSSSRLTAGCKIVSQDASESESLTSPRGQMFCCSTRVYQLQMPPFFSPLCQCLAAHASIAMISLLLPWEGWYPIVSELCVSDGEVVAVYYSATAAHRRFSLNTLLQNSSGKCFQESVLFHCLYLSLLCFIFSCYLPTPTNTLKRRERGREKAQNHKACSDPLPTCVPSDPITSVQL